MIFQIKEGDRIIGLLCDRCNQPFAAGDQTRLVPTQPTNGAIATVAEVHVSCPKKGTNNEIHPNQ